MISIDALILDFVGKNWLTLTLALVMFNGICSITPWTWDEKISKIFEDIINRLRPSEKLYGNRNGKPPDIPAPPIG